MRREDIIKSLLIIIIIIIKIPWQKTACTVKDLWNITKILPWAWHFINLGIPLLVPYTQTSFGALSHSSSLTLWLLCWHCQGKGALWGSPIKNIRVCNTLRIHLLHFKRLKGIQQVKITYIEDITWPLVLLVLCNISWASAAIDCNIFQHEKRNFVSPSDHVMFYLLYKHQWMPNHFT